MLSKKERNRTIMEDKKGVKNQSQDQIVEKKEHINRVTKSLIHNAENAKYGDGSIYAKETLDNALSLNKLYDELDKIGGEKIMKESTSEETKLSNFLERAKEFAYSGHEFKGTTYGDKVKFLRKIQGEITEKQTLTKTMYEKYIYDCLFELIGEDIRQVKKEALNCLLVDKN